MLEMAIGQTAEVTKCGIYGPTIGSYITRTKQDEFRYTTGVGTSQKLDGSKDATKYPEVRLLDSFFNGEKLKEGYRIEQPDKDKDVYLVFKNEKLEKIAYNFSQTSMIFMSGDCTAALVEELKQKYSETETPLKSGMKFKNDKLGFEFIISLFGNDFMLVSTGDGSTINLSKEGHKTVEKLLSGHSNLKRTK